MIDLTELHKEQKVDEVRSFSDMYFYAYILRL